ncbi:MAG: HD domain-containing phosphohydrolase [Chloroflexota bacterium]
MTTLQSVWQVLTAPYITSETESQREYMTRVVMGMILILVTIVSIPILIGWGIFRFDATTTIIILGLETIVILLWRLSYRGYWRLSSYFPPLLFFLLGLNGTLRFGMLTGSMLFYVIAILLAFMLHGARAQWFTLIASYLAYFLLGWLNNPLHLTIEERLTLSITVFSSFGGVSLLIWFSTRELHRSLRQIRTYATELQHIRDHLLVVNTSLQNEIIERKRAAEALQLSQQQYQLLFQTMLNGFALLHIQKDRQGRILDYLITEVNPAFENITGLRRDKTLGKSAISVLPELEPAWIELSAQASQTDVPLELSLYIERLDKHFEMYAYCPQEDQVALIFLDITERIQRQHEMEAILNVATTLRGAQSSDEMLPIILHLFTELFQTDGMAIGLREPQSGDTIFVAANHLAEELLGKHRKANEGITGHVMSQAQIYVNNNIAGDPHIIPDANLPAGFGIAALPLIVKDEPIGILLLGRFKDFTEADIRLMLALADMVANALQRATLNEETINRLHQLDTLHTVEKALTSSTDINYSLEMVVEQLVSRLEMDAADILFFEPSIHTLTYVAGAGFHQNTLYHTAIRIGKGFASQVAMDQKIIFIPDLTCQSCDEQTLRWIREEGFITYCGIPLIAKGEVNGVLELYSRTPHPFSEETFSYLDTLARQIAIAIDNAWLLQDLQRTNLELTLAYDTTLEGWAKALELRDKETEGHSKNVTRKTVELARRLGIPKEQWVNIRRGALLHDIGKMGIPDHILFKPGPLSDEEWKIMRLHPTYAYELLSPITFLRPALDIPYCHHERWDGSGYPRGLKGEEIPLSARIFAVVDVWDALQSNRPYRAAWPLPAIRQYLQEQAGIQFDPAVVEAFLRLLDEES